MGGRHPRRGQLEVHPGSASPLLGRPTQPFDEPFPFQARQGGIDAALGRTDDPAGAPAQALDEAETAAGPLAKGEQQDGARAQGYSTAYIVSLSENNSQDVEPAASSPPRRRWTPPRGSPPRGGSRRGWRPGGPGPVEGHVPALAALVLLGRRRGGRRTPSRACSASTPPFKRMRTPATSALATRVSPQEKKRYPRPGKRPRPRAGAARPPPGGPRLCRGSALVLARELRGAQAHGEAEEREEEVQEDGEGEDLDEHQSAPSIRPWPGECSCPKAW